MKVVAVPEFYHVLVFGGMSWNVPPGVCEGNRGTVYQVLGVELDGCMHHGMFHQVRSRRIVEQASGFVTLR